jgi:hypothetical protein
LKYNKFPQSRPTSRALRGLNHVDAEDPETMKAKQVEMKKAALARFSQKAQEKQGK